MDYVENNVWREATDKLSLYYIRLPDLFLTIAIQVSSFTAFRAHIEYASIQFIGLVIHQEQGSAIRVYQLLSEILKKGMLSSFAIWIA